MIKPDHATHCWRNSDSATIFYPVPVANAYSERNDWKIPPMNRDEFEKIFLTKILDPF